MEASPENGPTLLEAMINPDNPYHLGDSPKEEGGRGDREVTFGNPA